MEITSVIAVDYCPHCQRRPQMAHEGQYQVRCSCGAYGPECRSAHEAARRWKSVAQCMRQYQTFASEMLQVAVADKPRRYHS